MSILMCFFCHIDTNADGAFSLALGIVINTVREASVHHFTISY
jgi:hypothetical protein